MTLGFTKCRGKPWNGTSVWYEAGAQCMLSECLPRREGMMGSDPRQQEAECGVLEWKQDLSWLNELSLCSPLHPSGTLRPVHL